MSPEINTWFCDYCFLVNSCISMPTTGDMLHSYSLNKSILLIYSVSRQILPGSSLCYKQGLRHLVDGCKTFTLAQHGEQVKKKKKVKVRRGSESRLTRDLGSTPLPQRKAFSICSVPGPGRTCVPCRVRNLVHGACPISFPLALSATNGSHAHWAPVAGVLLQ